MERSNFSSPLPYPSVNGVVPNCRDLQLIRNDYAGLISELSAITQYVYHQFHAEKDGFLAIGRDLLSIAMVEMRHLNILGKLMLKLGGNPVFFYGRTPKFCPWNGRMIDDFQEICPMLENDLRLEQETIRAYARQAEQVSQPAIAEMLRRIILDEEIHENLLKQWLETT